MPEPADPLPTIEEGRYSFRMADRLGSGGMGDVFSGVDLKTGQRVAIKAIRELPTADAAIRFRREARAAGKIASKHIVQVRDFGLTRDGRALIVMELLEGETLERRFERERVLSPLHAISIVRQLLDTLVIVHENGIVHRDLKPANLFLERAQLGVSGAESLDFLKSIDFGASVFYRPDGQRTSAGVIGTPCYMAPEQFFGEGVDQRSDLYAVGVILYRAVSGRLPFRADSLAALAQQIAVGHAPRVGDEPLASLIERAMARKASARFRDARQFLAALDACERALGACGAVSANSVELGKMAFASQPVAAGAAARVEDERGAPHTSLAKRLDLPWRLTIALLVLSALGFATLLHLRRAQERDSTSRAALGEALVAAHGSAAAVSAAPRSPVIPSVAPLASTAPSASSAPSKLGSRAAHGAAPASARPHRPAANVAPARAPSASPAPSGALREYEPAPDIVDPWSARRPP